MSSGVASSLFPQYAGGMKGLFKSPALWVFLILVSLSFYVGKNVAPTWTMESAALDVQKDASGSLYYTKRGKPVYLNKVVPAAEAEITKENIQKLNQTYQKPIVKEEVIVKDVVTDGVSTKQYFKLSLLHHWGFWSLLPAITAILLCWVTKEPLTALLGGVVSGAFLLGLYDLTDAVFIPKLMTSGAAGILVLYLWLLGGLMGMWSKTGAAQAFADLMTKYVVKGPKTAKLVAWFLGIIFFQGGTVSTVLVGTTVKPLADKENISHEELSYIVDSTASPIASLIPFNAWPGFVQAFIFVSGVPFLVSEADRIAFFFASIPLSFYSLFAISFTFLLSIDKLPILGPRLKKAIKRSRETGQLDAPGSEPLVEHEDQSEIVPDNYTPHAIDFFVPLGVLISIAIGTYLSMGSPQVRWAFGVALLVAVAMAVLRGMTLRQVLDGLDGGFKSVIFGSIILLLAVTIGSLSRETGSGIYLVELLGGAIPYWALPVVLQLLTMVIAFSTGTSWGTYAVAFPLAMPLAWAVAGSAGLENPYFFMLVCFVTVLNGSVYGDQCSPISDTTVLSSVCTGCDLMDHVKTQFYPATVAAGLAAICWTTLVVLFA